MKLDSASSKNGTCYDLTVWKALNLLRLQIEILRLEYTVYGGIAVSKKVFLLLLLGILLFISGCLNGINSQKISVQKRISDEEAFEDFREITQKEQVKKAIDIIDNANWENEVVEMETYADYRFQIQFKNSSEPKVASYLMWISHDRESLEVVTDTGKYVKLNKENSSILYQILTGEKLKD